MKKSIDELVNALQSGERQYKAFKDGLELAEGVKSLENSQKELTASVDKLTKEEESAKEKSEKAKADLLVLEKKVSTVEQDAQAAAALIKKTAKEDAEKTKADAQDFCDQLRANVNMEVSQKLEELSALTQKVADLKKEQESLEMLKAQLAAKLK